MTGVIVIPRVVVPIFQCLEVVFHNVLKLLPRFFVHQLAVTVDASGRNAHRHTAVCLVITNIVHNPIFDEFSAQTRNIDNIVRFDAHEKGHHKCLECEF